MRDDDRHRRSEWVECRESDTATKKRWLFSDSAATPFSANLPSASSLCLPRAFGSGLKGVHGRETAAERENGANDVGEAQGPPRNEAAAVTRTEYEWGRSKTKKKTAKCRM